MDGQPTLELMNIFWLVNISVIIRMIQSKIRTFYVSFYKVFQTVSYDPGLDFGREKFDFKIFEQLGSVRRGSQGMELRLLKQNFRRRKEFPKCVEHNSNCF